MTMKPFADESGSTSIGELSAENGRTSVTISGSLEITRDKEGLKRARALRSLAETLCAELEAAADLPTRVNRAVRGDPEDVANPFA